MRQGLGEREMHNFHSKYMEAADSVIILRNTTILAYLCSCILLLIFIFQVVTFHESRRCLITNEETSVKTQTRLAAAAAAHRLTHGLWQVTTSITTTVTLKFRVPPNHYSAGNGTSIDRDTKGDMRISTLKCVIGTILASAVTANAHGEHGGDHGQEPLVAPNADWATRHMAGERD